MLYTAYIAPGIVQEGVLSTTTIHFFGATGIASFIAAPIGPILALFIADRIERKHVIVATIAISIICGLLFSQFTNAILLISMGICLTLAGNVMVSSYQAYQAELFPTSIRARAIGFVYSWSRFSAIFNGFMIAAVLKNFGVTGVFIFISCAMTIPMLAIGLMGPHTRNIALEQISNK